MVRLNAASKAKLDKFYDDQNLDKEKAREINNITEPNQDLCVCRYCDLVDRYRSTKDHDKCPLHMPKNVRWGGRWCCAHGEPCKYFVSNQKLADDKIIAKKAVVIEL